MGTMRGGGLGMGMRAERTPHGRSARAGQPDQPKKKFDVKKLWPQILGLVAPRKGLIAGGSGADGGESSGRACSAIYLQTAAGYGAFSRSS